jgi:hypothetical protein
MKTPDRAPPRRQSRAHDRKALSFKAFGSVWEFEHGRRLAHAPITKSGAVA